MMWKKVLLASVVTGALAGIAMPIQSTPADAARSGCKSREGKISNDRRSDRLFLKGEKDYIPSDRDSSLAGYIIAMGVLVGITVLVVRACEGSF